MCLDDTLSKKDIQWVTVIKNVETCIFAILTMGLFSSERIGSVENKRKEGTKENLR